MDDPSGHTEVAQEFPREGWDLGVGSYDFDSDNDVSDMIARRRRIRTERNKTQTDDEIRKLLCGERKAARKRPASASIGTACKTRAIEGSSDDFGGSPTEPPKQADFVLHLDSAAQSLPVSGVSAKIVRKRLKGKQPVPGE